MKDKEELKYVVVVGCGWREYDAMCDLKSKVNELKNRGYIRKGGAEISRNRIGWYMVIQTMEKKMEKKEEYNKEVVERYREQIRKRFERKW